MNKFLLAVISVLLTLIAGAVSYTAKKVFDVDRTVVAMKQHLVDQGWRPVALAPVQPGLSLPGTVCGFGAPVRAKQDRVKALEAK